MREMMYVVRLEEWVWMSDADEWTTEERMRIPLSLGDCVSEAVVGVVKEFLDRVWRISVGSGR